MVGAGACKALAFRTGPGVPYMAAAGGGGVITIWNLEERRLAAVLQVCNWQRLKQLGLLRDLEERKRDKACLFQGLKETK